MSLSVKYQKAQEQLAVLEKKAQTCLEEHKEGYQKAILAQKQEIQSLGIKIEKASAVNAQRTLANAQCADGKNDGNISWGSKLLNFGKGCVNMFKNMFCDEKGFSLKRTLTTVGVAVGVGVLCLATAGTAIPALIAGAGAITAGVGVVNAGIKASEAKNDADCEKAWQGIGENSFACLLSFGGWRAAKKVNMNINGGKFNWWGHVGRKKPITPTPTNAAGAADDAANIANAADDVAQVAKPKKQSFIKRRFKKDTPEQSAAKGAVKEAERKVVDLQSKIDKARKSLEKQQNNFNRAVDEGRDAMPMFGKTNGKKLSKAQQAQQKASTAIDKLNKEIENLNSQLQTAKRAVSTAKGKLTRAQKSLPEKTSAPSKKQQDSAPAKSHQLESLESENLPLGDAIDKASTLFGKGKEITFGLATKAAENPYLKYPALISAYSPLNYKVNNLVPAEYVDEFKQVIIERSKAAPLSTEDATELARQFLEIKAQQKAETEAAQQQAQNQTSSATLTTTEIGKFGSATKPAYSGSYL